MSPKNPPHRYAVRPTATPPYRVVDAGMKYRGSNLATGVWCAVLLLAVIFGPAITWAVVERWGR